MQSLDRSPAANFSNQPGTATADALIQAFLSRIPAEHRAKVRERLLQTDTVVSAQSSDVEGQAILDRLYQLRRG